MILLSDLISKKVLNLYSNKIEGVVINVNFDKQYTKIKNLILIDSNEEEYQIDCTSIYDISDVIVIRNDQNITLNLSQIDNFENPILKPIYTLNGNYLGQITNIELSSNLKVEKFNTPTSSFTPKQIVNIGTNVLINKSDKKVLLHNFKPRKINISKTSSQKVNILAPQIENQTTMTGDTEFLIGRKASKTIYSINNELIVKKDSIVSKKHIELAQKHGKLAELTIFSTAN